MKTSKLLLITFIGLFFCIADVVVDSHDSDSFFRTEQLTQTAKSYFHKYFTDSSVSFDEIQNDITDATYQNGINNSYEKELTAMGEIHNGK